MEKEIFIGSERNHHFIDGSIHYETFNPYIVITVCDECGIEEDLYSIGGNQHLCNECLFNTEDTAAVKTAVRYSL